MKQWIKKWWCIFIHKKETKLVVFKDDLFVVSERKFEGCTKCDIWRRM